MQLKLNEVIIVIIVIVTKALLRNKNAQTRVSIAELLRPYHCSLIRKPGSPLTLPLVLKPEAIMFLKSSGQLF